MPIKHKLTEAGYDPQQALSMVGHVATALTATGATQGTALAITQATNIFTTVAASTGAILRSDLSYGDTQEVSNHGANALSVYPPVGGAISTGAANAAFSVPVGKTAIFRCTDNRNFNALLSA